MEFSCLALLGHHSGYIRFLVVAVSGVADKDCFTHFSSFRDLPSILMVISLFVLLADRDLSVDLSHDSFDLVLCESQIGIDLFLVNFVSLGKREHGNEAENEKRESVEPGADVSHHPEEDSELDGVD